MFKRIIACFLAFATVSLLTVPAIADYDSGDDSTADYVVKSLWTLAQGSDSVGIRSFIDTFFSSDPGCAVSSDGLHHWQLVSDPTISLMTNAFTVRCAFCEENYRYFLDGEEGTFISSELSDIYDTWVSSQSGFGGSSGGSLGGSVSVISDSSSGSGAGSYDRVISASPSSLSGYVDRAATNPVSAAGLSLAYPLYSFSVPFDGYYNLSTYFELSGYPSTGNFGFEYRLWNMSTGDVVTDHSSSRSISHTSMDYISVTCPVSLTYYLNSHSTYAFVFIPCYSTVSTIYPGINFVQESAYDIVFNGMSLSYDRTATGNITKPTLPVYTRPAYYASDATKLVKTSDNTASGSVTNVYTTNIFNESTKVFTEPTTGQQYLCDSWRYDYVNPYRGYKLDIADGSYTYNGTEVGYVYLMYFDDYLLILGYHDQDWINDIPSTATEAETAAAMLQNAVFVDKYFYAVPTSSGSSSSGSSPYIFTETTTGQQYMVESIKTSFDGSDRTICLDLVDDTYEYQGTSLTHILLDYSDSSVLISGYADDTILVSATSTWPDREDALFSELHYYSVEVEGNTDQTSRVLGWFETFKTWLGEKLDNLGDGSGSFDNPFSSSGGFFGWLGDKVKSVLDGIVGGISSGLESIIEGTMQGLADGLQYLIEHVIKTVVDLVMDLIRWLFGLFDGESVHSFFGWFDGDNPVFSDLDLNMEGE